MGGRFRVIGPPGTGKTTVGMDLVDRALMKRVSPYKIIYSSYTLAAAREARNRALERFGEYDFEHFPYFRTCHSIAFRLLGGREQCKLFVGNHLNAFGKQYGYKFSEQGALSDISDDVESYDMVLGEDHDYFENFLQFWKGSLIPDITKALQRYEHAMGGNLPGVLNKGTITQYCERRQRYIIENGFFGDFADILLAVLNNGLYPDSELMIVDECQDNSKLMSAVFNFWERHCKGEAYYIGDPSQCLYSWNGAAPEVFTEMYYDDQQVLSQSYRVPKSHHRVAMNIIRQNRDYIGEYKPTEKEGTVVKTPELRWKEILDQGKTFFICRTRYLLALQFEELMKAGVPFFTNRGKQPPLQSKKAGCVYAFYKLLEGEPVTLHELANSVQTYLPAKDYIQNKRKLMGMAKENPTKIVSKRDLPGLGFLEALTSQLRYFIHFLKMPALEKSYFETMFRNYGLNVFTRNPKLMLSTPHGVKGLECATTILYLGFTKKVMDGYNYNPAPERRVGYVSTTRATDRLFLLESDRGYSWPI